MAEEEKPEVLEDQEKEKSRKWPWIALAIIVFVTAAGAGIYFFGVMPGAAEAEVPASTGSKAVAAPQMLTERVKSIMKLDAFLVNLADPDGVRFLKVTFHLGLDQSKLGDAFAADPVVLAATRDRINFILSTKTVEQILSPEGKGALCREIRDVVNSILPTGKVVDVYILDFVMQL